MYVAKSDMIETTERGSEMRKIRPVYVGTQYAKRVGGLYMNTCDTCGYPFPHKFVRTTCYGCQVRAHKGK